MVCLSPKDKRVRGGRRMEDGNGFRIIRSRFSIETSHAKNELLVFLLLLLPPPIWTGELVLKLESPAAEKVFAPPSKSKIGCEESGCIFV